MNNHKKFERWRLVLPAAVGLSIIAAACGSNTESGLSQRATANPASEAITTEMDRIVHDRVDSGRNIGMVAGMLLPDGSMHVVAYGDAGNGIAIDSDTVFEIGSITKTFTATLLANMVINGEVHLSDPVAELLPDNVTIPSRNGHVITLDELATHTSGLPRQPTNFNSTVPGNDYAGYSTDLLYQFLGNYELTRDPGSESEYSNIGVGLLGQALAAEAVHTYDDALRTRVLDPLDMPDTSIALTSEMEEHIAVGHDDAGAIAPYFEMAAMSPAGGMRSNITDMLTYAAANLDSDSGPLHEAMALARSPRREFDNQQIGLNWLIGTPGSEEIIWHGGATAGFSSFIGLNEANHTAVVILTNSKVSVEDIGIHLLDSSVPLVAEAVQPTAITLPAAVLDNYVGTYDTKGGTVTITRSGQNLTLQIPEQPSVTILPSSTTSFFLDGVNAQIEFQLDPDGLATAAEYHQDGNTTVATRHRDAITLNREVLDRYVGTYEIAGATATITRTADGLVAELGNDTLLMYAETATTFFFKDTPGVVTFTIDTTGTVTGGTLVQDGETLLATKVG
jgi:D-alanyl-D-alanine-carboxypeptidase/D-alanyl-D-alanine-endopeptidase